MYLITMRLANFVITKVVFQFAAQKMKFSVKDFSSVNVTKSAGNCGFGHIY